MSGYQCPQVQWYWPSWNYIPTFACNGCFVVSYGGGILFIDGKPTYQCTSCLDKMRPAPTSDKEDATRDP